MLNVSIGAEKELNRPLLDEFKIQEDVRMLGRIPECDDFRFFDLESEGDLATVSKRTYGDLPNQRGKRFKIIYLPRVYVRNYLNR